MSDDHTHVGEKSFSMLIFSIIIISSISTCLLIVYAFFPEVWNVQVKASIISHIIIFVSAHFCFSLVEHFFHRYVLHARLIPGLSHFYKSHTKHHALTSIALQKGKVRNKYPILEEEQHQNSFFPWYSYFAFVLVILVPMIALQMLFKEFPIVCGTLFALAWSLSLYEILHAFEHKSLEFWEPKIEHSNPWMRMFWRKAYAFHLRHHADNKCNEGISGFFGIPIADFLFKTWVDPETLYPHGSEGLAKEFISPRPVFFIRWLDTISDNRMKRLRKQS